ncbi:MAG: FAD-binding oxidoreductase [Alphaproteobacteria bacterium]
MTIETDILIIGGGIAGCGTAYFLAREGAEVVVIERDDLNAHASGANSGSLHAQIPYEPFIEDEAWARAFAPTLRLLKASIALWQDLPGALGEDLEVSLKGGLLVAASEVQMRNVERKAALERASGLDVRILSRSDLHAMAPYLSDGMIGGAFCPDEGKASPLLTTLALARGARRHGARIVAHCPLTALVRENGGFVATTPQGPIRARRVVNAAGSEATVISRKLGLDFPIEGVPIQIAITEPTTAVLPHLLYYAGGRLTLKQTAAGTVLIGGGWPAREDPRTGRLQIDRDSMADNLGIACNVVPLVGGLRLVRSWPAMVNGTADWKPVLGEVRGIPGFYMTVFPWLGFSAGPIVARITADLLLGRDPGFDLAPFSAERYLA